MFKLVKQKAVIAHLNIRTEKHGDDEVLAEDVKVTADVGNAFLDELAPGLRAALYQPAPGASGDLVDSPAPLQSLRFGSLGTLGWAGKIKGTAFTVHGAKKADDLVFDGELKGVRFTPKEGGTVALEFKVGILPEAAETGALAALLEQEVKVSLKPGTQVADDGGGASDDGGAGSEEE